MNDGINTRDRSLNILTPADADAVARAEPMYAVQWANVRPFKNVAIVHHRIEQHVVRPRTILEPGQNNAFHVYAVGPNDYGVEPGDVIAVKLKGSEHTTEVLHVEFPDGSGRECRVFPLDTIGGAIVGHEPFPWDRLLT